jgi:hypothetical protein
MLKKGETKLQITPFDNNVKELLGLLDTAEQYMKLVELETGKYCEPSANELRYALRHFLEYFEFEEEKENKYLKAKNHISRAIYDAKEIVLMLYLDRAKDFQDKYKTISITDVIKDWVDIRKTLNNAKSRLLDKKFKEDMNSFDVVYKDLKIIMETMDAAIEELDKKLIYSKKNHLYFAISIIITAISLIVAVFK